MHVDMHLYLPGRTFLDFHRPKCPCPHHMSQFRRNNLYRSRIGHRPWWAYVEALCDRCCDAPFHVEEHDTWKWGEFKC